MMKIKCNFHINYYFNDLYYIIDKYKNIFINKRNFKNAGNLILNNIFKKDNPLPVPTLKQ